MNRNNRLIRWILNCGGFIVLIGLISCHGGIFGTGDGSDDGSIGVENGSIGDQEPGTTDGGSGTTGADGSTDGGTSGTDGTSNGLDGGSDSTQTPATQSFINDSPVTDRTDALITIVNASEQLILVTTTSGGAAMPLPLIDPQSSSNHISLDPNQVHSLNVFDARTSSTEPLATITTAMLGAASVSTIIIRDINGAFNVMPLITSIASSNVTLSKIRFVQASAFGNSGIIGDISFQSGGANPGGSEHTYPNISFDNPIGDYIELPAGDYILGDSADRFENQLVTMQGGSVITYIMTGSTDPILIIENDSEIELSP